MDLEARIIALLIYCILLLLSVFGITKLYMKYIKFILISYLIGLSVMAFFYAPMPSADLYRLIPIMNWYAQMSIDELLDSIRNSNASTPGVAIYYYLIGQLGNDGFLAGITAFIVYSICFSILYDYYKRNKINKKHLALVLFLFMSRGLFLIIISNVRTGLSLAIAFWCVYQEMVNQRGILKNLPLYLIACSLHTIGQIVFVIRLFFENIYLHKNNIRIWNFIFSLILTLGIIYVGIKYGVFEKLSGKANNYLIKFSTGTGYTYFWEALINWYFIGIYIYILKIRNKLLLYCDKKEGHNKLNKIKAFISMLLFIDVVAFFIEYNFFYRLEWFISMLYIPMLIIVFRISEEKQLYSAKLYNTIMLSSLFALLLECLRGDLCGLKFW